VGGPASLEVSPGTVLLDTPGFPHNSERKPSWGARHSTAEAGEGTRLDVRIALGDVRSWDAHRPVSGWVKTKVLTAADGRSHISYEDFAVAVLDEIEQPKHRRERFTVGY